MKQTLTIASFNIQNPNMNKRQDQKEIMTELIAIIKKEKIDILCCQEMLKSSINYLQQNLPDYQVIASYRYGNNLISNNLSPLKKYNESTPIITRLQVVQTNHHNLPWFPKKIKEVKDSIFKYHSLTPRIITESVVKINEQYSIKVFNTHLEKRIETIKKKQLKRIEKYITRSTYPILLAGDFNMGIDQKTLQEFIKTLENRNLKRVEWNHKTWKFSKKDIAIDHIFIPSEFEIVQQKVVENNISDHYMLLTRIKIN